MAERYFGLPLHPFPTFFKCYKKCAFNNTKRTWSCLSYTNKLLQPRESTPLFLLLSMSWRTDIWSRKPPLSTFFQGKEPQRTVSPLLPLLLHLLLRGRPKMKLPIHWKAKCWYQGQKIFNTIKFVFFLSF